MSWLIQLSLNDLRFQASDEGYDLTAHLARMWSSVVRGKEVFDHFKTRIRFLDMRHVAGVREHRPAYICNVISEGLNDHLGGFIVATRNQQGGGVDSVQPIDD
jgi:hypothetical protein